MKCPVEKENLKSILIHKVELDVCNKCNGVWFSAEELAKVTGEFASGNWLDKWEFNKYADETKGLQHGHDVTLQCPKDYADMVEYQFAGNSKIYIHRCPKCNGFWFDGNEVMHLREYVKPNHFKDMLANAIYHDINRNRVLEKKYRENLIKKVTRTNMSMAPFPFNIVGYLVGVAGERLYDYGKPLGWFSMHLTQEGRWLMIFILAVIMILVSIYL